MTQTMTKEEQEERLEQAKVTTDYLVKESQKRGFQQATDTAKNVLLNLEKIEMKERCIRVRFLDWLSDKLLTWSKKVHEMSVKIDSPCVIRLPEKK